MTNSWPSFFLEGKYFTYSPQPPYWDIMRTFTQRWLEHRLMTNYWPSIFPRGEVLHVQPSTALLRYYVNFHPARTTVTNWTDYACSLVVTYPTINTGSYGVWVGWSDGSPPPKKIVWDLQKIDGLLLVSQGEFAYFDFSYNYITFMITTKKGVWEVSGGCLDGVWGLSGGISGSGWCLSDVWGCLLGVWRCLGGVWEVSVGYLRGVWGFRCCLLGL